MPGTSNSGGRNKRSRKEHELAGTYRKDRHGAKADPPAPDPPKGRPPCPRELAGVARAEWTRMVTRLEDNKTLSIVDDAVLYQYCCLFAETEGLDASRRTNLRLVEKLEASLDRMPRGDADALARVATAIANLRKLDAKHVQQLRQGHAELRHYLVEFGMTPAARSRVKVIAAPASTTTDPPDPFAEFDAPQGQSTH